MLNINEFLFKSEGVKYDASLDLNMGCYHIQMSENSSSLCNIILPRVKIPLQAFTNWI